MAIQETRVSASYNKAAIGDIPLSRIASPTTSKKKNRKGGLSMFLSGALDDIPKSAAPPLVMTKSEGPAWGGAKFSQGSTSLRDIQDEQSKIETKPTRKKESEDYSEGILGGKLPLSSFLHSPPIAVVPARKGQIPDGDRNTPPWAASGTPPSLSRPSLRDIQFQQVCFIHLSMYPSVELSTLLSAYFMCTLWVIFDVGIFSLLSEYKFQICTQFGRRKLHYYAACFHVVAADAVIIYSINSPLWFSIKKQPFKPVYAFLTNYFVLQKPKRKKGGSEVPSVLEET